MLFELNKSFGVGAKKYFRSILNVLSFAVFILDVCGLAFFAEFLFLVCF